jgi:uncharacterized protein
METQISRKMKILFYLGHPAHFHLFRHAISHFGKNSVVVIKSKDVLKTLLTEHDVPFTEVEESRITGGKISLMFRMLSRSSKIFRIIRREKPAVLAGSPAELAFTGKVTGVPVCMFFEDDVEKVYPYGSITGPFATHMICPDVCSAGKWNNKKVGYPSYHELAYLHPDHFTPDKKLVQHLFGDRQRYFILRFVELGAFHDAGKTGITNQFALDLVRKLEIHGKVHISSERTLPGVLEPYRISIPAAHMHHALYFSDIFIGDSQTMTAEAAVLGTPALRYNDFVGELSYLEELEHRYELTYGFKTGMTNDLLEKVQQLLNRDDLREEWQLRREKMLGEKINLARWMIEFLERYP